MELIYKGKNWLNQKVGSYTIIGEGKLIKFKSQKSSIRYWKVKCDCGSEKEISKWHLVYGNVHGCNDCYGDRHRFEKSHLWKGDSIHVTGMYFNKIKKCAEKRKIPFSVTREDLDKVFQSQNGLCVYTKFPLNFETSGKMGTASLDRINSKDGYTSTNIQWVHKDVNSMKWDLSNEKFIEICQIITENYNKNIK
jgi:hypothetical protein